MRNRATSSVQMKGLLSARVTTTINFNERRAMDLVLITGLSGSGKSIALNVLADAGWGFL